VRARAGSVSACSLGKIKERESRQKTTARRSRNAMDAVGVLLTGTSRFLTQEKPLLSLLLAQLVI
jgi:hypothetical protein